MYAQSRQILDRGTRQAIINEINTLHVELRINLYAGNMCDERLIAYLAHLRSKLEYRQKGLKEPEWAY